MKSRPPPVPCIYEMAVYIHCVTYKLIPKVYILLKKDVWAMRKTRPVPLPILDGMGAYNLCYEEIPRPYQKGWRLIIIPIHKTLAHTGRGMHI